MTWKTEMHGSNKPEDNKDGPPARGYPPSPEGSHGRRRLTADAWLLLLEAYRATLPAPLSSQSLATPPIHPPPNAWQTRDVGPWAKWTLAAGFTTLVLFPTAFPLMFPFGSVVAVFLGIHHIHRRLDGLTPTTIGRGISPFASLTACPYAEWVHEGRSTHQAVEGALAGLPKGLRRTFWPLTQQSEDLVHSLQRLADRARQIDDYLATDATASLRSRVGRLRTRLETAEDPIVREHLRQADLSLQSAIRDQDEIRLLLERLTAQAAHVNAALHHVLAQLVKQRFASPDGAWRDYRAVAERLKSLRCQIDAVEQVMVDQQLLLDARGEIDDE